MRKSIKIPWNEFVQASITAEDGIYTSNLKTGKISFMIVRHDGDREICELPDYVEIELEPKPTK